MSPNMNLFQTFFLVAVATSTASVSSSSFSNADNHAKSSAVKLQSYPQIAIDNVLLHLRPEDLTRIVDRENDTLRRSGSITRDLAVGDFDELNRLFQDATISLPDAELGSDGANLNIRNLRCMEFNLGDLQSSFTTTTDTLTYEVIVEPFAMTCYGDYEYQLSFLANGSGSFSATTQGNRLQTSINLVSSSGFDLSPPTQANLLSCQTTIDIVGGIDFEGGIVADVANLFTEPIANLVENEAADAVCDQLSTLGTNALQNLLNETNTRVTEWLQPIPENYSNPLLAEQNYDSPEGVTLLNWQGNDTESVSDLLVQLLKNSEMLWGGSEKNANGEEELSINVFMRDNILDDKGALDIALSEVGEGFNPVLYQVHDQMTQSIIRVEGIRIVGLDTLTKFEPITVIGNYTISNDFAWEKLTIEVRVSVEIEPSSKPDAFIKDATPETIVENIVIGVDLVDLNVDLALFVAMDKDKFDELRVGSIIDISSLLPCFLSTMSSIEIAGLDVSLADLSVPALDGFISPGIDRVLSQLAEAGFAIFKPTILRAIPYVFQVSVRDILKTKVIDKVLKTDDESKCPKNKLLSGSEGEIPFIDLRDLIVKAPDALLLGGSGEAPYGTLISTAVDFLNKNFFGPDPDTELSLINKKVLLPLTEAQSGTPGSLFFPGELINQDNRVNAGGLDARIQIRANDAYIHNLDTVGSPLTLLKPVNGSAFLLDNNATAGSRRPLILGIRLFFGMYGGDDSNIENDVEITVAVEELRILLTLFAKISVNSLINFPLKDITNLQCWLATFPAPKLDSRGVRVYDDDASVLLTEFVAAVARVDLNVSCVQCTSPKVIELANLLSSSPSTQSATEAANEAFDLLSSLFEENFFQLTVDRALHDAPKKCPHMPDYDPEFSGTVYQDFDVEAADDSGSFFLALFIVSFVLLALVMIAVLTTKIIVRRRHRKWISSLPASQKVLLQRQQERDEDMKSKVNHSSQSLFRSDVIPFWVRWIMPLIILGNIGLFLSGHLSLGASVSIIASIAGQPFEEKGFFEFSMARSTIEIWNAGGQELAILIFLLSFAWPYTKTVITFVLWFASPKFVSVERRGAIFIWLDALAKWSFADIFVLILTIVSFRVSVKSPDNGLLPPDFYSLDLLVIPKWGLYANMTAQLITQISSHFIIHFNRRVVENAKRGNDDGIPDLAINSTEPSEEDEESQNSSPQPNNKFLQIKDQSNQLDLDNAKVSLSDHAFRRFHRGESDKIVPRSFVKPLLVVLSTSLSLLVVIGCVVPSYSVSFLGIVGLLVESGQGFAAAETDYSVTSTIQLLFDQARFTGRAADFVGLGTLSILLIFTVLIVPVLQSSLLLVQWFIPLTRNRRHQLSTALEIFSAWQYIEVYLLSLLVASWQLGSISEAMINPYCESLRGIFAEFVYYGLLKDEDAQCFKVNIDVEPTFYVLFAAALVLLVVNSVITKAVSQYFRELDTDWAFLACVNKIDHDVCGGDSSMESFDPSSIGPVPVLFTDRYRWMLQREDTIASRRTSERNESGS